MGERVQTESKKKERDSRRGKRECKHFESICESGQGSEVSNVYLVNQRLISTFGIKTILTVFQEGHTRAKTVKVGIPHRLSSGDSLAGFKG